MNQRKKLVVGNWKMNGNKASLAEARAMADGGAGVSAFVDLAICPPATLAGLAADAVKGSVVALGGQDCHTEAKGAFTGDVSAEMWADLGADIRHCRPFRAPRVPRRDRRHGRRQSRSCCSRWSHPDHLPG